MTTLESRNRYLADGRRNSIIENLGTALLSLILALIVWIIATNETNPIVQGTYDRAIPVTVRGLDGTLEPVQDLSGRTVELTIRAPQDRWENLSPEDFTAFIDLTDLGAGEHDVEVQVTRFDTAVEVLDAQPNELHVELDEVQTKELPVRVVLMDGPAFGYDAQTPLVEPITVTVSGPATQVEQVINARAEVFLNSAKSQVDQVVPVELRNGQNQVVPQTTAEPTLVRVIVPIEQRPGRKEVAVRPKLVGQPASGYRLGSVRVTPSTVVLTGDSDILAQVPGFVETAEISLDGAVNSLEERVALVLPDGVSAAEGSTVLLSATITPIESGTTLRQTPVVQGLGPGLTSTVSIDEVEVILSGPQPMLESLEPDDMFVILDLTGLLPGSHVIRPTVVLPPGIREEGVLPETVEVVITANASFTPAVPGTTSVPPTSPAPAASTTPPPGTTAVAPESNLATPRPSPTVTPSPAP